MRIMFTHREFALFLVSTAFLTGSSVVDSATIAGRCNAGCGKPRKADGKTRSFTINSTCCSNITPTRNYDIHLPTNYNPNNPTALILSYHGAGETTEDQERQSQLSNESYNPDMIVVYPEGFNVSLIEASMT